MENLTRTNPVVLACCGIQKAFGGHPALKGVDLNLRAGEIHALMGENGAGKSTLIKILTGIYSCDAGNITLHGTEIHPTSGADAQNLGVSTVYQEVNLVPSLSVAENIYLGREPKRFGMIAWKQVHRGAEIAMARLGLKLDVRKPLEEYSIAIQQMTAIARALDQDAKVLILDEATSSLDASEVASLFGLLRELKKQGLAILLVTHFLDQVYEITDRLTILRNGALIGEYLTSETPRLEVVSKMMGRELADFAMHEPSDAASKKAFAAPWLECKSVGRSGSIAPFDLQFSKGETVGLAGLLGSGRTETANTLFGLDPSDSGDIYIDGRKSSITSPRAAIFQRFAYLAEDRKALGIFPELSVRENIVLALQARKGWARFLPFKKQNEIAEKYIKALRIKARDAEQPIGTLSGGNQQKAILARWLATDPRLLILDEPTRGIDVGAKAEIQELINRLAADGLSVLFISSEIEEVVRNSDRVEVLKDREQIAGFNGPQITEQNIMKALAATARIQ